MFEKNRLTFHAQTYFQAKLGAHVHSCLWWSNNIAVQFLIYRISYMLAISKRNTKMLSVKSLHFNKVIGNNLLQVNRYKSAVPNTPKLIYQCVFMKICFSGQRSKPHTNYFSEGCQCLSVEWQIPFIAIYPCLCMPQLCFPLVWEQDQEQNQLPCSHLSSPAWTGQILPGETFP